MPAPHPVDLRERVVHAYKTHSLTQQQVAQLFGVGIASVKRWCRRDRQGSLAPDPMGGDRRTILDDEDDAFLVSVVEVRPDITIAELREVVCTVREVQVSTSAISRALSRLGFSRKKGIYGPWSRTDLTSGRLVKT